VKRKMLKKNVVREKTEAYQFFSYTGGRMNDSQSEISRLLEKNPRKGIGSSLR